MRKQNFKIYVGGETIRVGISSQIPMTLRTTNVPIFFYSSFRFFFSFFYVLYTSDVIFKIYEGLYLSNSYQDNVVYSEKNMNHVCVFPPRRPHSFFRKLSFLKLHNSKWHFATFYQKQQYKQYLPVSQTLRAYRAIKKTQKRGIFREFRAPNFFKY